MTLQEIKSAIDRLSYTELHQLRRYIDNRELQTHPAQGLSEDERVQALTSAAAALREGLSAEELADMTSAMNEEYIEPVDEDIWKD